MKKLLFLFALFVLLSCICYSQNLVPNNSFELYDICPNYFEQIENAIGWLNVTPSSDFFHQCTHNYNISVPDNAMGYQAPVNPNCKGYAGIYTYGPFSNYREYFGALLINPLTIGVKYYISMHLVLADESNCGINKVGILFSSILLSYNNNFITTFPNYAHLYSTNIISEKNNWVRINGSFITDSSYNYILIGNFFDDNLTDTMKLNNMNCVSYYFIDDICVSTDSLTCNPGIEICTVGIEEKKSNQFYYLSNPSIKGGVSIYFSDEIIKQKPMFKIFDYTGKLINEQNITDNEFYYINNEIKQGFYVIQIHTNKKIFSKKIILY